MFDAARQVRSHDGPDKCGGRKKTLSFRASQLLYCFFIHKNTIFIAFENKKCFGKTYFFMVVIFNMQYNCLVQ